MILAKELHPIYEDEPQQRRQKKIKRKTVKKHKWGYVFIVVIAFVLGLIFAGKVANTTVNAYQLEETKKQLAQLEAENVQLTMELNKLSSLDRIEVIAKEDLGMEFPVGKEYVVLEAKHMDETSANKSVSSQQNITQNNFEQASDQGPVTNLINLVVSGKNSLKSLSYVAKRP